MTIFKHTFFSLSVGFYTAYAAGLNAASVELKNGDVLSGEVSAFNTETLSLKSGVSYEPLQVNSSAIQRILFEKHSKIPEAHGERLTLANGDIIPCNILSLDKDQLNISTWYAGDFTVKRQQIRSIQFGTNDQRIIYNGQDELSRWTTRTGSWTKSDDHTLTSRGSSVLSRKFDLPKNLRVSYTLTWKGSPNFVFRFCGENQSATTKQDTYEFSFNTAGMQLRRFTKGTYSGAPLANIPLKPSNFSSQSVKLDFHINRDLGRITLFVDGTKAGTWPDQLNELTGNYIILNNRSSKNTLNFKNIIITDLNDGSLPRHREPINKGKSDVFLDSKGDIYSGSILSISNNDPNELIMRFKQDPFSNTFEAPENRISSLNFSQNDNGSKLAPGDFAALFHSRGQIQLTEPKFASGYIEANHPILGKCKIDLKAISQFKKYSP